MKTLKNILLIIMYIVVLPVATIFTCAMNTFVVPIIYNSFFIIITDTIDDFLWGTGVILLGALAGAIGSIPIWFVDCENRVLKIIRQIIAIAIYIVATALFWIMLLSM